MIWYKVKWIDPLFSAFNQVWPNRNHAQDGTIGDAAHMTGTSGHNPDDTPGVKAERQDADNIPEVRAADVDSRGVDMERAVQAVLHNEPLLGRLIYIIFNRRIWSKSNGWKQETYTGSDPHDTHAHFSGDPASDEDGRPWQSILNLGGTVPNAAETNASRNSFGISQQQDSWKVIAGDVDGGGEVTVTNKLKTALAEILAAAQTPVTVTLTDEQLDVLATKVAQKLGALVFRADV